MSTGAPSVLDGHARCMQGGREGLPYSKLEVTGKVRL